MDHSASGALPALGRTLEGRAAEVAAAVAARAERLLASYAPDVSAMIRADILRTCATATATVANFLMTGRSPTAEQWKPLAAAGRAPAENSITLADMTKLYLYWRDAALAVVGEDAARLGIDGATRVHAEMVVRGGCDASLVRMAKTFDVNRRTLQMQLAEERARLAHLARHDSLTGLPNRLALFDRLDELIDACREGRGAVVLFIDLDRFKTVNDTAGHHAGDELLVAVARRLRGALRPRDLLARLGGDEFVAACDLSDPVRDGPAVADRLRAALAAPFGVEGRPYHASASIGFTIVRPDDDPQRVLSDADAAMYLEKQRRRDATPVR